MIFAFLSCVNVLTLATISDIIDSDYIVGSYAHQSKHEGYIQEENKLALELSEQCRSEEGAYDSLRKLLVDLNGTYIVDIAKLHNMPDNRSNQVNNMIRRVK